MKNHDILVYIESDIDGNPLEVGLELGARAAELSKSLENSRIIGITIGSNINTEILSEKTSKSGFDKILVVQNSKLQYFSNELYSKILIDAINEIKPHIFLVGATVYGRDLAPTVASKLELGLVADCINLQINDKHQLEATRPTFGESLMATILSKTYPQMASIRPGVFKIPENLPQKDVQVYYIEPDIEHIEQKTEILEFILKPENTSSELENADIILAGGRGMKSKENFEKLEKLAKLIHAKIGASRVAVEAGFAEHTKQIGQTGKTVHPKIYIAFGISGAVQHKVGMDKSSVIIAINPDKNAPIHTYSDYSIFEDATTVVDEWIRLAS